MVKPATSRRRAMRAGSMPLRARPSRQVWAVSAASWSGVTPSRAAAASSIQGRKSCGRSSGNVSRRLPMSPLGSMTRQGTPCSSASSSRSMPRPVLPEPVMPTITPWVVRSAGSTVSGPSTSDRWPMKSSVGSMPVMFPSPAASPGTWGASSPPKLPDSGHHGAHARTGARSPGRPAGQPTARSSSPSRTASRRPLAASRSPRGPWPLPCARRR